MSVETEKSDHENNFGSIPIEYLPDGVLVIEKTGLKVVACNTTACRLLDCSPGTLKNTRADLLFTGRESFLKKLPQWENYFHYHLQTAEGQERLLKVLLHSNCNGDDNWMTLFLRDISDTDADMQRLTAELDRQRTLMREMNHRVKNNLLMISSLINLKSMQLGDDTILANLNGQVESILAIHHQLSEAGTDMKIRLQLFLASIISNACASFQCTDIELEFLVPEITVHSRTASTIGLIVNEMAMNTGKYGFPGNWSGKKRIRIELRREAESDKEWWTLMLSHNGPPIENHKEKESSEGTGMMLIKALAQQLYGDFTLEKKPNPAYMIRFPAPDDFQATGS